MSKCSKNLWDDFAAKYEKSNIPTVVVDAEVKVVWSNTAGEAFFESEAMSPDDKRVFFAMLSTVYDKIVDNSPMILAYSLCGCDCKLTVLPFFSKTSFSACAIMLAGIEHKPKIAEDEASQRMIDTFAHQTRAPLSTIFSALAGISRCNDEFGDPDVQEYINKISLQAFRLLRSSAAITEQHRYESGEKNFLPQEQDIALFLQQLCRVVSVRMQGMGVKFYFSLPGAAVPVSFDGEKIATVLLNIFSNAAKFAGDSPEIKVSLSMTEKYAVVSVIDNGMGIKEDELASVFDDYYSRDPKTESICGDGLGLALCRRIILEHDGFVFVASREGEGTRAVFYLPLSTERNSAELTVRDVANEYMSNRFSKMYVILSDVCPPPFL
ncbi:MAG: HAMP domain-containing sensor histidine kinase [Hydrogenoanaerobacterium sp.]